MPGGHLPLVAAGLAATLLPPPLVQAEMAEPSTMVAQMPIAAGTLVMRLASPLLQNPRHRIGQPLSVESYFPLSVADRFVVGIAAGSELSFETGVPLLANPGGGWGVEAWEGSVEGATGVPLCPSPVLDLL